MDIWSLEKIYIDLKRRTLLVLVNATTHKTSKVKEKFKECDTSLPMIPSRLTWKLQPLDIVINKILNENLRKDMLIIISKLITQRSQNVQ